MELKKIIIGLCLSLWFDTGLMAQELPKGRLSGTIVSAETEQGVEGIELYVRSAKVLQTTGLQGVFSIEGINYGNHEIVILHRNVELRRIQVKVDAPDTDLGRLRVTVPEDPATEYREVIAGITLDDQVTDGEGDSGDQQISGVLTGSKDPLLAAAAFSFAAFRYQLRGYGRNQTEVYLNGTLMNDAPDGAAIWGLWSGLNDVFRNQYTTFGLQAGEEGPGGLAGLTTINAIAAAQRKQVRVSYGIANRAYRNRLMLTYNTGQLHNGWAFSFAVSRRWAKEGYIQGTSYNAHSFYAALSRKTGKYGMLHFTAFGASVLRGKAMPVTQEAIELAGDHFYNPNWGYLDGEKKNARMNSTFQPVFLLNYEYNPDKNLHINIAAAYRTGYNGNSALDWYNALDPRPDYYRNLPGYYRNDPDGADPETAEMVRKEWLNNPERRQVDWLRLYEVNRLNNVTINNTSGLRSLYVIGEDRADTRKYDCAAQLLYAMDGHITINAGIYYSQQRTAYYRKMLDLLGGDYYVNLNQFAEQAYAGNSTFYQNDLNNPDAIIREGDKYSYHYLARFTKARVFGHAAFSYQRIDFFLAAGAGMTMYSRQGLFRNGLFPQESYGKGAVQRFLNYQLKAGITYKLDGRNYLFLNAAAMTGPPLFDHTFYSPRTRNKTVTDPHSEKISGMEAGYLLRSPACNGRLTGFVSDIKDAVKVMRFYHEDYRTFVNYVMHHVSVRHLGAEIALQAKLSPSFSATAVITWMQVFYTTNPDVSIYSDNDTSTKASRSTAYLNNYYVAAGPQSAYMLGVNYRSPKFWYAGISGNLADRNYVAINPSRRTADAVDLIVPGTAAWHHILDQKKLPAAFTLDVSGGRSILLSKAMKWLPRNTFLYINAGVSNILDNKNIINGAFEQLRFDFSGHNPERFPEKYFYGYGRNYFINLSMKF
jgi:hypothetical protein